MMRLSCYIGIVVTSVLAFGSAASCQEPKPAEPKPSAIKPAVPTPAEPAQRLTETDNGKTIKVKVGDTVTVLLQGNPTTGYSWRTAKLDGTALEQAGDANYTSAPNPSGMAGVGGAFLFTFTAAKAGETRINLENVFPGGKDVKPVKTFVVTVDVEEKVPAGNTQSQVVPGRQSYRVVRRWLRWRR
jgi:predicted secreted protein